MLSIKKPFNKKYSNVPDHLSCRRPHHALQLRLDKGDELAREKEGGGSKISVEDKNYCVGTASNYQVTTKIHDKFKTTKYHFAQ